MFWHHFANIHVLQCLGRSLPCSKKRQSDLTGAAVNVFLFVNRVVSLKHMIALENVCTVKSSRGYLSFSN